MLKLIKAFLVTVGVILCCISFQSFATARTVLTSNFSAGAFYTDNLFFTQVNKTETVGASLAPSIGIEYINPDVVFGLRWTGVGQIFPDESGANRFIQNAAIYLDLPFLTKNYRGLEIRLITNLTFTPSLDTFGGFDQTDATLSNPGIGAESGAGATGLNTGVSGVGGNVSGVPGVGNNGIQVRRTNIFRSLIGANVRYPWTRRFTLSGFYRNLNTIFLDVDETTPDSNINTLSGSATYDFYVSPATIGNIAYTFQPVLSDITSPIIQNRITVGGTQRFNPTLVLTGRAGVNFTVDQPTSAVANLSLSQLYEGGQISVRYRQGVGLAQGFADSATLTQVGTVTLSHTLGERITGYAQFSGSRNNSLSGDDIDILAWGGGAGITMILLEWLSGGINYNFFRQEKQGGTFGNDGERTFINFFLTAFADPIKVFE